jgi:putative ABC transport system ATP-binding protein
MRTAPPQKIEQIAISAEGIVKQFGSGETLTRVLNNISVEVPTGDMTFLVGPSGCGKTTLVSVLAGILTPEQGEVSLFGRSIRSLRGAALARFRRANIGFIFQQFNLLPSLSATENAAIPLIAAGTSSSDAHGKARLILERLGLAKHADKFPNQLSGGQQQRIAIARALVHDPRLIVCDEPTASLDAASGQSVMEMLRDIAVKPGRAVILVTHDNRIFKFADRIIRMVDGRIERIEEGEALAHSIHEKESA